MRIALLVAATLCLACSEPGGLGPLAERCGEAATFYLGLEAPVTVDGGEVDVDERRARIDYRGERANLPLEGVALCRFRALADGGLELSGAFVDENRLRPDEVEAFNAARPPRAGEFQ